jgi:hypothetical protein
MRTLSSFLVVGLLIATLTAPASAGGLAGRWAERRQAKREFKLLLHDHPELAKFRRSAIGIKSAALKVAGLVPALPGAVVGLANTLFIDAPLVSEPHLIGAGALGAAGGFAVAGWKLAANVRRSANTKTVSYALQHGIAIPPAQLKRWTDANIIKGQ